MAVFGLSSITYYATAGLLFLIPVALVSAELATAWPQRGGMLHWVGEAFGPRAGFLSIWMLWVQNIFWFPLVLSFAAAAFAYLFNPTLAENPIYTISVVLSVYWGATLANLRGMKVSAWVSTVGVWLGTLVPGLLVIGLGVVWIVSGRPPATDLSPLSMFPRFEGLSSVVLATSVFLAYAGIEMSGIHALEVKHPRRDYPRAILLSALIIVSVYVLGTLAVAIVVPSDEISLVAGLMQGFVALTERFQIAWLVPLLGFMVAFGAFGQVSTWVAGPSKGLLEAQHMGFLPEVFHRVNRHGAHVNILLAQAVVVTVLSSIFLLMPSVSSSYWALTVLTAQMYIFTYIMILTSAIVLRFKKPDVDRPYRVPGGNLGMWIVAGTGIIASLIAALVGYIPPSQVDTGSILIFEAFLVGGLVIAAAYPLLATKR